VLRVEEAGRATLRERLTSHAGAHTTRGVPAVLEDLDHVFDLVGLGDLTDRLLGGLVGVQRALVVLPRSVAEVLADHFQVEVLQFLAEPGDVLVGGALHRLELAGGDLVLLAGLQLGPTVRAIRQHRDHHDGDDQDEVHVGPLSMALRRAYPTPQDALATQGDAMPGKQSPSAHNR
jgi:hypothetical protein